MHTVYSGQLSADQQGMFCNLIDFLKYNNNYYKRIICNIPASASLGMNDFLAQLPIMSKQEIRLNYSDFISNVEEELLEELTSGSTGTPLKCVKTRSERIEAGLALWRARREWDPEVTVQNFITLSGEHTRDNIGNFFKLDADNLNSCMTNLLAREPRWVSGPITVFDRIARLIEKGQILYSKGQIKFIELAGEYPVPEQREFIERIFGCSTVNQYGTRECWGIAYECPHKTLHVFEHIWVEQLIDLHSEIVNSESSSNGQILVTSLINKAMPIIRYKLGDIGTVFKRQCDCGKSGQVIELAGGRTGDILYGEHIYLGDLFFKRLIQDGVIEYGMDFIEQFQVEQLAIDSFLVHIVPTLGYTARVSDRIVQLISQSLGPVKVEVKVTPTIPALPGGKFKTFHSHIINQIW